MPSEQNDLLRILHVDETQKDRQIAKLESDLAAEVDARKEERFYWVILAVFLMDGALFPHMGHGATFYFIVLQLILLVVVGRRCGVDDIVSATQAVVNALRRIFPKLG